MKALIVGGTKGYGKELSNTLAAEGYEIITVGRSKIKSKNHYICDIGDLNKWKITIEKIKFNHKDGFNVIIFVLGFAKAKHFNKLTIKDWNEAFTKNITYIALALQKLSLKKNTKIVTIGSGWSYNVGSDFLVPYIVAKHALRSFTEDFAVRNRKRNLQINHYCLPTTNTPGFRKIAASFKRINKKGADNFSTKIIADPKIITKALIAHLLKSNLSGETFIISPQGKINQDSPLRKN